MGKKVQLLLEEEERFSPFDVAAWEASAGQADRTASNMAGLPITVPPAICEMIDRNLADAVTYRRRNFEAEAMMAELCTRNGIVLPQQRAEAWPEGRASVRVAVICNEASAGHVLAELLVATTDSRLVCLTHDEAELATADRVLLVLTAGVLTPGSATLQKLEDVLLQDRTSSTDRFVAIFSEQDGWKFGCAEQKSAPAEVQAALEQHEALA